MDELDMARRAVRRSLLSEEQLREAQSFASGGRSLLSVLLDLGYLRPQDIADLTQISPPTTAKRSGLGGVSLVLITALVTGFFVHSCDGDGRFVYRHEPPPMIVQEARAVGPVLLVKGEEILSAVQEERKQDGNLNSAQEKRLRHAAELIEEALAQGCDPDAGNYALGRAHEALDHWELAAECYRKVLAREERNPAANLGLARVLLLLDRPLQAHSFAIIASQGPTEAEAWLVRAKANMNLGNKREARENLETALRKDPELRVAVRALQQRLDE